MNFLKEIKSKAIAAVTQVKQSKKTQQSENKIKQEASKPDKSQNFFSHMKNKALASAIFQLGLKRKDMDSIRAEKGNKAQESQKGYEKMRKTADSTEIGEQQEEENEEKITIDSSEAFIMNLVAAVKNHEKQQNMKVNKAKAQIFSSIEVEPIYMSAEIGHKILSMELQACPQNQLLERSRELVQEQVAVDQAIQKVLFSGYLYKANQLQQKSLLQGCKILLQQNLQKVQLLNGCISQYRNKTKPLIEHYKKMRNYRNRQQILIKKISLLEKLKTYSRDVCVKVENIDQAFFVERNRQKVYSHLVRKDEIVQKVQIFKKLKEKVWLANKNTVRILHQCLKSWIDDGVEMQKKQIEKTLILLYFVKTQMMYRENKLFYCFSQISDKKKLREQLKKILKWQNYHYINHQNVKNSVTEFLAAWIQELQLKGRNVRIQVTTRSE